MDLFASAKTKQDPKCCSLVHRDPALLGDAFQIPWSGMLFNVPPSLLSRGLAFLVAVVFARRGSEWATLRVGAPFKKVFKEKVCIGKFPWDSRDPDGPRRPP